MAAYVLTLSSLFAEEAAPSGHRSPPFDFSAAARWKKFSRNPSCSDAGPNDGLGSNVSFRDCLKDCRMD
jgi:hypothetical protein